MLLTLDRFLDHFKHIKINGKTYNIYENRETPQLVIDKVTFVKNLIITYKGNPTLEDLFNMTNKSVIKSENDKRYLMRHQIIDYLYDIIILNRFKYLESFYNAYFYFEDPFTMKWTSEFNQNDKKSKESKEVNINIQTGTANDFLKTQEYKTVYENYMNDYSEGTEKDMLIVFNKYLDSKLNAVSMQKNDNSRRIIRNLNYLDILNTTKVTNTCKSVHSFWESLTDVYTKLILADRFFAPSSIDLFFKQKNSKWELNYNNFFYLFQQYQPKASILNPYTISYIFKYYLKGEKLFTPVLSWCSYIVSYVFSEYKEYVGTDVIPEVCEKAEYLFNYLMNQSLEHKDHSSKFMKKKPVIYCKPSESLLQDNNFMKKYTGYFDTVLMCPPYFDMEIYKEGEQSIKTYPKYSDWLDGYWENTVALSYKTLKKHGKFSFIVNNYDSLKGESYPLINDLNIITLKYFKLINCFQLVNRGSPLRMNFKDRTEMLFIYEKID